MRIYRVEIKGQGVAPYEFPTMAAAKDYALTMTAWSGGAYRIHTTRQGVRA